MAIIWRYLRYGSVILGGVYLVILTSMYIGQRALVFDTRDMSNLRSPSTQAIEGGRRLTLLTADGEKLAAWFRPPRESRQVFLFFHGKGGGLARKKWRWRRIINRGFGVLAFSYRGYPGSSGSPSERGLHEDARTAYRWLRQRYPAKQIVLHGLSLGSGVATKLASEVSARALILEAPYTAVVDVAGERYPLLPVHALMWDQFLSRKWIKAVRMPILIAHGTGDTVVPFAHGKRLFALAPEPKTFVAFPGSDHSTLVRDGLYPHIWKFLDRLAR